MPNQQVQPIVPPPTSLQTPEPATITAALLKTHSITDEEYAAIESKLGRTPSMTELGIFSVMWSEHCSYKSSRVHLKRLPTKGTRLSGPGSVVQGPGENAGIIDVGDSWGVRVQDRKPQSSELHRAVSGCGHGRRRHSAGYLHDGGQGPLAVMDSLRFGPLTPEDAQSTSPIGLCTQPPDDGRRRARRGRVWQLLRRAEPGRRDAV